MNAYDADDGKIVLDMIKHDIAPGFPNTDGTPTKASPQGSGRLVRWTLDVEGKSGGYTEQQLCDLPAEFPRDDERFSMQRYRHGYMMSSSIADT